MGRVLVDGNDLHDLANPTLLAAWWGAIAMYPKVYICPIVLLLKILL